MKRNNDIKINTDAILTNYRAVCEKTGVPVMAVIKADAYGLYPSDEVSPALLPLQPAMSWYSRVSHVKTLPAGRQISYGGTYVTTVPTRVATIPVAMPMATAVLFPENSMC